MPTQTPVMATCSRVFFMPSMANLRAGVLYDKIIERAFGEMGFTSITILFPPSRTRIKGILRLGFELDDEITIGGERFIRYRLTKEPRKISESTLF